jgi:uracil-DNA glycosylase family 4
VSKGAQDSRSELGAILGEAVRHLEWLRDAGVGDVPAAAAGEAGKRSASSVRRARSAASPGAARAADTPSPSPSTPARTAQPAHHRYAQSDKGCGSPALLAIREEVGECTRCKLAGGRTKLVFGVGDASAELMFVGEGPGADEDLQGEPFVGKAGQLLTKMIEAMGFRREQVYIANVVKCRPPGNRDPEGDEIAACEQFLKAQIAAVKPRVLVALGRFAVQTLLRDATPISRQRGRWRTYEGVRLMPTFHPAYLLRNPAEKKKAWEDLQQVMKDLGKPLPVR